MLALFCSVANAGCASIPSDVATLDPEAAAIELTATPFYPQERYQCGPAALTTVLAQSGTSTTLASMVDAVYIPGRQGSLQAEMMAAARGAGRIPYRIDPSIAAIHRELLQNRPVLVLQNLGIGALPRWHYAVVVGIEPDEDIVYLRSGQEPRRETRLRTFLRTWQRSEFWGMIVLPPGEIPEQPDAGRFASAVAAFEAPDRHREAMASWTAGVDRWPDNTTMLFGAAGAAYAEADYALAADYYRRIIGIDSAHVFARNNLSMALAKLGRFQEANYELDQAMDIESLGEHEIGILRTTRLDIQRLQDPD